MPRTLRDSDGTGVIKKRKRLLCTIEMRDMDNHSTQYFLNGTFFLPVNLTAKIVLGIIQSLKAIFC